MATRPKRISSSSVDPPDRNSINRRWLTTAAAAYHACVSVQTVRTWIHNGDLPVVRIGGFRIDREDLDRFLERKKSIERPYARHTHPWVRLRHAEARAQREKKPSGGAA